MADEHLFIVVYDITDPGRWRRVYRLMQGYGEWVQLSVFQCRLSPRRRAQLLASVDDLIDHKDDQLLVLDVGIAGKAGIVSLGRPFVSLERAPLIV